MCKTCLALEAGFVALHIDEEIPGDRDEMLNRLKAMSFNPLLAGCCSAFSALGKGRAFPAATGTSIPV